MFKTDTITVSSSCTAYSTSASSDYFHMLRDMPKKVAQTLIDFDPRFEIVYEQLATKGAINYAADRSNAAYISAVVLSHSALDGVYLQITHPTSCLNNDGHVDNVLYIGTRRDIPATVTPASQGFLRSTTITPYAKYNDLTHSFNLRLTLRDDANFFAIGAANYNVSPNVYNYMFLDTSNVMDVEVPEKAYVFNGTYMDASDTTHYMVYPTYYLPILIDEDNGKPVITSKIFISTVSGSAAVNGYVCKDCIAVASGQLLALRHYIVDNRKYYALTDRILVAEE